MSTHPVASQEPEPAGAAGRLRAPRRRQQLRAPFSPGGKCMCLSCPRPGFLRRGPPTARASAGNPDAVPEADRQATGGVSGITESEPPNPTRQPLGRGPAEPLGGRGVAACRAGPRQESPAGEEHSSVPTARLVTTPASLWRHPAGTDIAAAPRVPAAKGSSHLLAGRFSLCSVLIRSSASVPMLGRCDLPIDTGEAPLDIPPCLHSL